MHWTSARHAGFCPPTVTPWLPVDAAHADGVNVADQRDDPGSLLSFYRRLLHLRRATPALVVGDYEDLGAAGPDCLAYLRRDPDHGRAVAVLLNMSDAVQRIDLGLGPSAARVLLAEPARALETVDLDIVTLPPHAVLIVALE
jgi:glycosidase